MDHLLRPWLHLDLIPTQQLSEICEAGLWATIIKTQNKKIKKTETRVIRAGVVEAWILFQISIYLKNYYWLIHSPIKQWLVCNFATCALKMCQNDLKSSFFLNFLNFCRAFQKYSANNIRKKTTSQSEESVNWFWPKVENSKREIFGWAFLHTIQHCSSKMKVTVIWYLKKNCKTFKVDISMDFS